jgi:imidazolonepropionase-like amidohydrolase
MLAGSEAGFSVTRYGEWHSRELELMTKFLGMSAMDALLAATRNNAKVFGWLGKIGTLEKNSRADLLIVDGDPLTDITVLGRPEKILAIIKDGIEVERRSKLPERRRMAHERGYTVSTKALNRADTIGRSLS